jgi:hypothetical protein
MVLGGHAVAILIAIMMDWISEPAYGHAFCPKVTAAAPHRFASCLLLRVVSSHSRICRHLVTELQVHALAYFRTEGCIEAASAGLARGPCAADQMRLKPDVCDVPLKRIVAQQELAWGLAPALAIAAMQVCACACTGVTSFFISTMETCSGFSEKRG